jgi:putative Mg2+ transporter-C (MgtC) family protein
VSKDLVRLGAAYLLSVPIGWERERAHETMSAGLRTFPLVALASCAFVLIGVSGLDPATHGHVLYGVMTGLGFIGAGAIIKGEAGVHGTATAASVWATGAIGAGVGFGRYDIAIALCVLTYVTLRFARPFLRKGA